MDAVERFWETPDRVDGRLEARLAFARLVESSLATEPARPSRRRGRGVAALLASASLVAGLATTGGISYAASSLEAVARVSQRPAAPRTAIVVRGLTAGGDQYLPGYGFGDPEHNHEGPPGLRIDKTEAAADVSQPAEPTRDALAKIVGANVSFDEQVHLYISVIGPDRRPLLLTQTSKRGGSKVGESLDGPQTKVIQYAVLVPRTIPIQLRVPANLLAPRATYRIRVVAVDPQGNRSTLLIPFRP